MQVLRGFVDGVMLTVVIVVMADGHLSGWGLVFAGIVGVYVLVDLVKRLIFEFDISILG